MDAQEVLRDVGLIVAAGLAAIPVAALLRLPNMIVMVAAGALVGPSALGWVSNPVTDLGAELVFTFGVSLILFHGGLDTSLRVISQTAVGLGVLVLPGMALTALVVALVVWPVFSVPFSVALLAGAVLAATDPAILVPLFDRLGLRPKVAQTLIAESAFNDPSSTVLALTVAGVVASGDISTGGLLGDFSKSLAFGAVLGIAGGLVLSAMLSARAVGIWRESPAMAVLGLLALAYATTEELGGSAYLAAFVMGLVAGNVDLYGADRREEHERALSSYMRQTSEMAVLLVFVTLGINLPFDAMWDNFWGGLLVMAVFILVARPLTVYLSLLPDRRGRWQRNELVFMSWCRETGAVPAAVASLLLAREIDGAELIVSLVALAIVVTLLLQATTAGVLARRLGLVEEPVESPGGSPLGA
ncbi:MAG TPA: sodium:proton antiporter [Gaiella sp.]|jgi:cell volume regulation protein A